MPKSKRMKNNASSALGRMAKQTLKDSEEDSRGSNRLLVKHHQIRSSIFKEHSSSAYGDDEQMTPLEGQAPMTEKKVMRREFIVNLDILKILTRSNFPTRFPMKISNDSEMGNVIVQEDGQDLIPVPAATSKMTKVFTKFWNKVITRQDMSTSSSLDHQLTEYEAGYYPCQLKTLFDSPESYLKKAYCQKETYRGQGHELLPKGNHFFKISLRSMARMELNAIFDHYANPANQYYLIPIELSSKLSRSMLKSNEISKQSLGCNKINFLCQNQPAVGEEKHPLFTVDYRASIELEVLPCNGMSLVNNLLPLKCFGSSLPNQDLLSCFFNYPYLSHFLSRSDVWVDDFYARSWHYSRYFCDKLNLGGRIKGLSAILMKDSIFKYLLACSARISVAIKYWVLNPEGATYFRCWCGQSVYDPKQENKLLGKMPVGSSDLFNYQQKIRDQEAFHSKHGDRKASLHLCACNEQFNDHKAWMNHMLSTKLSDINSICPIFLYLLSQQSFKDNQYLCECSQTFSDYDFWSFLLHVSSCHVVKKALKNRCTCNLSDKTPRGGDGSTTARKARSVGKAKNPRKTRSRSFISGDKKNNENFSEESDNHDEPEEEMEDRSDKSHSSTKMSNDPSDDKCHSGNNLDLPLKVSNQMNF